MRHPQGKRPATITRLRTKPERLRREQGEQLRQAVLSLDLPERPISQVVAAIDGQVAAENGWTFVMISPAANNAVVSWLAQHSSRPMVAVRLWAALFTTLRHDTAEVVATRQELAEAVGVKPNEVSRIMGELESINAILRRHEGRGVRYFLNPNIGTKLSGAAREQVQRAAGPVRLEVVR